MSAISVSVVIPAYNAAKWIERSVQSALDAVDPLGGEVVVVDDGSTDATRSLAGTLEARILVNSRNRGIGYTLSRGFREAQHDHVAWLSADDVYFPKGAMAAFKRHIDGGCDLTFCNYSLVNESLHPIRDVVYPHLLAPVSPQICHDNLLADLVSACFINGSTVIARKSKIAAVGFFPEKYAYANDYALWLSLAAGGASFAHDSEVVGARTVHRGQLSASLRVRVAMAAERRRIFRDLRVGEHETRLLARVAGSPLSRRVLRLSLRVLTAGYPGTALRVLSAAR